MHNTNPIAVEANSADLVMVDTPTKGILITPLFPPYRHEPLILLL
jgi:hypothetical protein